MKKNGYTLVELMTVIVIIGILLLIAVPAISQYMKRGMQEYHARLEESLLLAGRDYLADYRTLLPREIGNVTVIDPEELIKNGYLDGNTEGIEEDGKIKDENGKECSARVVAKRLANNKYEYDTCLICEDYQTEGEACSYDENNNVTEETKYYQVEVERDTYEVGQGEPFELPYGQAYYTKDGKKELVEEKVVGNPRIINTNKLGKTKVRYAYKGAYQEITVEVVDQVAPSIPEVVLRYENEKGNLYRDNWYSGDIYQEFQSLDYSKPGVMGSGIDHYEISTDGEHYEKIEGNHQTTNENGKHTYYVRSVDRKGNTGEAKQYSFKIDQEIPGCSLEVKSGTPGQNGWYTSDVTIDFKSITETVSGIFYQNIDIPSITSNTKETKVTGIVTDLAGNTKTCSITVKLDKTTPNAPIIKASDQIESNQWHNKDFTLNYSGANNISENVYYYGTTADPKIEGASTTIDTTSVTSAGTTYYVKVCSKAGLCSRNSIYVAKLDKVTPAAPTITISDQITSGNWHNQDFTLSYSGANNVSGNTYYYGTSNKPATEGNSTTINTTSSTDAGTTYYIKVCSTAGLCSENSSYVAKLDKVTPPLPTIVASDGKDSGAWHGSAFYLSLFGASNVSGNTYYYGTDNTPTTPGSRIDYSSNTSGTTYYVKVCSGAGLCNGNSSYTIKLDQTKPSQPSISGNGASGSWHTNDFDITCGVNGTSTSQLTCYYGTDPDHMTPGDRGSVRDNTAGQNHYFKVCNEAMVCSDLVTYDAKLDKTGPTISGNTNGYIQQGASDSITNYFSSNYGVSGSGSIQCNLDNGTVITDINQLPLGVNNVTCTITSVSGRSSSASVTFRHQYPASLTCTNGRQLDSNGNCTYYYTNDEGQCGCNSYNSREDASCPGTPTYQACRDDSFDCEEYNQVCSGTTTKYKYQNFSCEEINSGYIYDNASTALGACQQASGNIGCLPGNCDTYSKKVCNDWKDGTCKLHKEERKAPCPVEHYPSCQLPKFGCNVANSCTKTENQYLTYQCNQQGNNGSTGALNGTICSF